MNNRTIVGLGTVVVDQQMILTDFPAENQKERAASFRQQIGGPVPTALVLLQRLGNSTHFIGRWGADANGEAIESDFSAENIRWCESCRHSDQVTGTAHVWTSVRTGSRTIVANPASWDGFELSTAQRRQLNDCDLLHLDGNGGDVAVQAAEIVRSNGGRVTLDAGAPKEATAKLIPLSDVVSFPERFAQQFFDDRDVCRAGAEILKRGAATAVCTQGENGAIVFEAEGETHVPAFPVKVTDTTGAGDVFCGGMIAGLCADRSLFEAVQFGAAAAALKCCSFGNRDALPTIEEIRLMLEG